MVSMVPGLARPQRGRAYPEKYPQAWQEPHLQVGELAEQTALDGSREKQFVRM